MLFEEDPAEKIREALYAAFVAYECDNACEHLARALGYHGEENEDGESWRPDGMSSHDVYRKAYGAKLFDARECFSFDWFEYLSTAELRRLARHLRAHDDWQERMFAAAYRAEAESRALLDE